MSPCVAESSRHALATQFGTKFTEMDALSGRHQTTRGIWLARSPKLQSQVTQWNSRSDSHTSALHPPSQSVNA